jgi:regulator of cell morphogenesis and NO signaling
MENIIYGGPGMDNRFEASEKIGDIVSRFPKAGDVFKKYNIDFCCGGNRPLSEAIEGSGLNEGEILHKLDEAYADTMTLKGRDIDWRTAPLSSLADYIVDTHHAYLHKELPQLSELTAKILRVHGMRHKELAKVHTLFSTLRMDLEQHLIKEEELLFPLIRDYEKKPSPSMLDEMIRAKDELESEHTGAGDIVKELRRITNHYTVPEDGCTTFAMTLNRLEAMESDLFQHIHLENNILFKRLDELRAKKLH